MAQKREELLHSTEIYRGRVLRLTCDEVRLPNGEEGIREVVHHHGGACVLALDDEGQVYVVHQYRHATGREMLELPAGKLEPGEEALCAARRELAEEAGLQADDWRPLGFFYPTVGYCDERIHLFLARGLHEVPMQLDADEFLQPDRMPLAELAHLCATGAVQDAKTALAVLRVCALQAAGEI